MLTPLTVTYATYKSATSFLSVYYVTRASFYLAISFGQGLFYRCLITDAGDIADFEATLKPTATEAPTQDEAMALAAIADIPIPMSARNVSKNQPFILASRDIVYHGTRDVAALNATTDFDFSYAEDRELQGFGVIVANFTDGDYLEHFVCLPGTPPTVIGQFTETNYVPATGIIGCSTELSKTLPAGFILRTSYTAVATTGNQPVIITNWKTWK